MATIIIPSVEKPLAPYLSESQPLIGPITAKPASMGIMYIPAQKGVDA